jgi:hypothetical protein
MTVSSLLEYLVCSWNWDVGDVGEEVRGVVPTVENEVTEADGEKGSFFEGR